MQSYGVVWREDALPTASGKLELRPSALRFEGAAGGRPTTREVAYESLAVVRVGRAASDRVDGRPSLVLERRTGLPVTIASVGQSGVVAELAERLAGLQLGADARRRTAFVLPLVEGAFERARALLQAEPRANPLPDRGGVLADPGREDKRVEAAERDRHRPDRPGDPVVEDVEREPRVGILGCLELLDATRAPGEPEEARLALQRFLDLLGREQPVPQEVE